MMDPLRPIQTQPRGLLGLLQLKSLGRQPDTLLAEVRPTVDMLDLWLQGVSTSLPDVYTRAAVTTGAGAIVAFTTPGVLGPPPGETWWVENFLLDIFIPAAAADSIRAVAPIIIWNTVGTLQYGYLGESKTVNSVAGVNTRDQMGAGGFWLPPGAQLGVAYGQVVSAGGITLSGYVRRSRLAV